MPEKELYIIRLPCHQDYWFKLHLYGDEAAADKTCHVELNQFYKPGQGTIFCKNAVRDMTKFTTVTSLECEDDEQHKIIQ